ncbi:MAG: SDR family NAD(P)-dependent oxidoreductase [Propionibacteriaceae bacterium]|nr:SDR family NAD(P)-dependent oxidoreductase [Propionibacteriaceae bacterium]
MRALVTGGSSGIGLAFARTLAEHGADLVLVARDGGKLDEVAAQLRAGYAIDVETMAVDLARPDDVAQVAARIEVDEKPCDVVINNAGIALHASLLDDDLALQETAMAIMVTAVLKLSNVAARAMVRRGTPGHIINVASASAWINVGNYSAIKAWVVSYTRGLAVELRGSGVTATAVCPGWVKTAFHDRAGVGRPKLPAFIWVDADVVAAEGLAAALAGRSVCVPSMKWRFAIWVAQHGPAVVAEKASQMLVSSRHSPNRLKGDDRVAE